jgi:polygalacturonase
VVRSFIVHLLTITCINVASVGGLHSEPFERATTPIGVVSITDYGASPNGTLDSTEAITEAINVAKFRNLKVFVPAGTFIHQHLSLNGVGMAGVGAASILLAPNPEDSTIFLRGSRPSLQSLTVKVQSTHRDGVNHAIWIERADNFTVDSVTVEGSNAGGIFDEGGSDGRIVRNNVKDTLADGIHNTDGAHNIVIAGNTVRGTGDDMIAVVSYA